MYARMSHIPVLIPVLYTANNYLALTIYHLCIIYYIPTQYTQQQIK